MKICINCKEKLSLDQFNKNKRQKDGLNYYCKDCQSLLAKVRTKEEASKYQKEYRRNQRIKLLQMLGGKCACCNENTYEFLTLDHLNGSGREHQRRYGNNIWQMYKDIIEEGAPNKKYRCLCYNCNCAIGRYGYCPHQNLGDFYATVNPMRT